MEYGLKILGESPRIGRDTRVVAECGCGVIKTYIGYNVRSGSTISCGCRARLGNRKHGMKGTRVYETWKNMIRRCTSPLNARWQRYGGRGITVCDQWMKFENFYEDMGDKSEGKELDRIDNNLGYFLGNCRWTTRKENMNNQEKSIKIEFGQMQLTIVELAELGAVSRNTMYGRWHKYKDAWKCLFPTTD